MPDLEEEIKNNFDNFTVAWKGELTTIQTALDASEKVYLESYRRLTSINSWRELLVKNVMSDEAYRFFCEAQNDAVTSHVFARLGSWRAALKCLRSCIENILFSEYYKDHPVELRLWLQGMYKLSFTEAISYFQKHPDIEGSADLAGLELLQKEYSTLSRAVHGSDSNFRMTGPGGATNLWSCDTTKLGMWSTRERLTITGVNLFLLVLHAKSMQGASLPGLRKSIGLTINSAKKRKEIKKDLRVNLDMSP